MLLLEGVAMRRKNLLGRWTFREGGGGGQKGEHMNARRKGTYKRRTPETGRDSDVQCLADKPPRKEGFEAGLRGGGFPLLIVLENEKKLCKPQRKGKGITKLKRS